MNTNGHKGVILSPAGSGINSAKNLAQNAGYGKNKKIKKTY
jgi:hypothetical protein